MGWREWYGEEVDRKERRKAEVEEERVRNEKGRRSMKHALEMLEERDAEEEGEQSRGLGLGVPMSRERVDVDMEDGADDVEDSSSELTEFDSEPE